MVSTSLTPAVTALRLTNGLSLLCSQYIGQGGFTGTRRPPENHTGKPGPARTYTWPQPDAAGRQRCQIFRTEPPLSKWHIFRCARRRQKPETCIDTNLRLPELVNLSVFVRPFTYNSGCSQTLPDALFNIRRLSNNSGGFYHKILFLKLVFDIKVYPVSFLP